MNINPGELNKRIKFITTTSGQDADGFPIAEEITHHECWAKVTNTSGTELIKANAEFSEVKTRFLIRYTKKKIENFWTLVFIGNPYDIAYTNDYEFSHEYIEIFATLRR
ncbi:MAG: putative phage head-tail adaptor family [Herbinix sp.]|jgi:SPP1 family predicted phage head-tail adaptor|nr:putative phage head-tail adaptor family [Herbinix sp.]